MRTRIKICGITRLDDQAHAVREGVDALGYNFSLEAEQRCLEVEQAQSLLLDLPVFVTSVAIFTNQDTDFINHVLSLCQFDCVQFHGEESAEFCRSFAKPYLKAIGVDDEMDIEQQCALYPDTKGILLDTKVMGRAGGGAGKSFNWQRITPEIAQQITLAGGLNADNIQEAILQVKPYAVDVCGGVESGRKGIKDHPKITEFMREVRQSDSQIR